MESFSMLSHEEFENELDRFLTKNKRFKEVFDLNLYKGKSRYYIMVLDEYCQIYIGTTNDIKKRIMTHWSSSKPSDRLLFPMGKINSSIMSIDSFRAYDTTRIFVYVTESRYNKENEYINQFTEKFVCNRIAGGRMTRELVQAISMMKTRGLK